MFTRATLIVTRLLPFFAILVASNAAGGAETLKSPNGLLAITVSIDQGVPTYEVSYRRKTLISTSCLGLEPNLLGGFSLHAARRAEYSSSWRNAFGELSDVPDRYHELHCDLGHRSGAKLRITFRAYDEGVALRYTIPEQAQGAFHFTGERTEFRFPPGTFGWEEHGTEGPYQRVPVGDIQPWCERPLTLEFESGVLASLTEAANFNYPRMLLSAAEGEPGALVSALGGDTSNTESPNQMHNPNAVLRAGDSTPWRVLVVGDRAGDLLERNYLLLNLNPPCAIEDTSWIRPGKVMRDSEQTTANSKAVIDFAEEAGLSYVHIDWKWYGSENAETGDATTVRLPDLDLNEIVNYGRQKNVGLTVYVDRRQIRSQRDTLFPLYKRWGLAGVKLGFVNVGPQSESAYMTETIQTAAEHRLMLNIHDGYRSTGINRTYPNLMTIEGIRGNEHMPTAEHNCTLPFTRYVTGIGDYTVCYYNNRIQTTHAHQLAMCVVSFSPLQWVFWYDTPDLYRGEPEIEFIREVPTVWDETRVLQGEIGQYAVIARRSRDQWFVGAINAGTARTLDVPLDFLPDGQEYVASIYSDDETVDTRTNVRVERTRVTRESTLQAALVPSGGQAYWIKPLEEDGG